MNAIPKPVRHIERPYRDWIKTLPCLVKTRAPMIAYCEGAVDPHHVIPEGGGKTGSKVSDRRCVPMCRHHHRIAPHPQRLESYYEIDVEAEIRALNIQYDATHKPQTKREIEKPHRLQAVCGICRKKHPLKSDRDGLLFWCSLRREYVRVVA